MKICLSDILSLFLDGLNVFAANSRQFLEEHLLGVHCSLCLNVPHDLSPLFQGQVAMVLHVHS